MNTKPQRYERDADMLHSSTTEHQCPSEFLTLALLKAFCSLFDIQGTGCQGKKRILGKKVKKNLKNHNTQGEGQGISLKNRLHVLRESTYIEGPF